MSGISRRVAIKVVYWNVCAAVVLIALAGVSVLRRAHQYDALIVRQSRAYGVDPRLIAAVIWKESRFNPASVGEAGEIGLMQVTDAAAREWAEAEGVEDYTNYDLFHPETNLRAGIWYLKRAIDRWSDKRDPLPFALAEYNAGRSNALRWEEAHPAAGDFIEHINFPTTRRYVRDVLARYRGGF